GVLTKVADNTTAIPSGTGTFANFGQPSIAAGKLAFQAVGTNQEGIYSYSAGSLTKVVNKLTARPEGGTFTSFGDPAVQDGVFALINSTVNRIADLKTTIPGTLGHFTGFGVSSLGGSSVAFVGYDQNNAPGIYAWVNGELNTILDSSVMLGGKKITGLDISRD